jgi:hypothetical protein
VRDRLKELDPPPLSNYIDPTTIDNIEKARRKPPKPGQAKPKKDENAVVEHKARINKMRELYGLFVKMEGEVEGAIKAGESPDEQVNITVKPNRQTVGIKVPLADDMLSQM